MMTKILLANIGNRNLLHNGEMINNKDFLSITQRLYDDFKEEKDQLSLNIIDPLIDARDAWDKIILFSTFQGDSGIASDTRYEGLIMQKLISEQLPDTEVEIKELKKKSKDQNYVGVNPTDENDLINAYKKIVKKIRRDIEDLHVTYLDAGGTPQQKAALKTVLEFLLNEDQLTLLAGVQNGKDTKINKLERTKYKETLILDQVIKMLGIHQYTAVNKLLEETSASDLVKSLVEFQELRWLHLSEKIKRYTGSYKKWIEELPGFEGINNYRKKYYGPCDFGDNLSEGDLFWCRELLLSTKAFQQLEDYSYLVLSFHQFLEHFVNASMSKYGYNMDNYETEAARFEREMKDSGEIKFPQDWGYIKAGIPAFLIFLERKSDSDTYIEVLQLIKRTQAKTGSLKISSLRNKFVHRGIGVKKGDYQKLKPILEQLYNIFDIQDKMDYNRVNELIVSLL